MSKARKRTQRELCKDAERHRDGEKEKGQEAKKLRAELRDKGRCERQREKERGGKGKTVWREIKQTERGA